MDGTQQRVAHRYRVLDTLGRGGMGVVYRVLDESTDACLALKVLTAEGHPRTAMISALFEHEYHTLSQLTHPGVVEVHDYGVSDEGPYYTMELLDGQDLRERTGLDQRGACALLRDVCSALSLLHSRRLVHRDLTPRNVRVTSDGRAKLIDFGAMAAFGVSSPVIGTPPFMAPEVLRKQPLDGRSDLFAVGALAYWLVTGRHAYPARKPHELHALWKRPVTPPASLSDDVPEALEQLILSLLCIDPDGRPSSAAEVMHRLSVIAQLPESAELEVAQSYLTTPRLVGREVELAEFQQALDACAEGRGGTVILSADSGVGRTRLLASFALSAKLAGALVCRVDGASLTREPLAIAEPVLAELSLNLEERTAPDGGEQAAPEAEAPQASAADLATRSRALLSRIVDASRAQPVVLLVDEVASLDATSLALLIELSELARGARVLLAAAVATDRTQRAAAERLGALGEHAQHVTLRPLDEAETCELLRSVFGEDERLSAIAAIVQRVGDGKPGVSMQLLQHLVERNIVRYRAGGWELPEDLSQLELPDDVEQLMQARVQALGADAREIALALALSAPMLVEPLRVQAYPRLFEGELSAAALFAGLDELLAAGVLVAGNDHYAFSSEAMRKAVIDAAPEQARIARHRRLGEFHASTPEGMERVAPYHLRLAGERRRTFELMAQPLPDDMALDDARVRLGRTPEGLSLFHWALDHIERYQTPPLLTRHVYGSALKLSAVADPTLTRCAEPALAAFVHDSGRDLFDEIDPELDAEERLQRCFAMAQARWETTPEAQRGLPPAIGIQQLALAVATLAASYVRTLDAAAMQPLPELVAPFTAFPAVAVVHEIADMCAEWGRGNQIRQRRLRALEMMAEPIPAMGEITRQGAINISTYYTGLSEAHLGMEQALERADYLQNQPFYTALGWDVRVHHCMQRGLGPELAAAREERALAALRESDADQHRLVGPIFEIAALSQIDDLMGLTRLAQRMQTDAELYAGWRPLRLYAEGCRQLMMGDAQGALARLERATQLAPLGAHPTGELPLEALLRALLQAGAHERAHELAVATERRIAELGLRPEHEPRLRTTLALCAARAGHHAQARAQLTAQLDEVIASGRRGLVRGSLHEALCRVALLAGDRGESEAHLRMMAEEYRPGGLPGLVARHERVQTAARLRWMSEDLRQAELVDVATGGPGRFDQGSLAVDADRVERALTLAIEDACCHGGALFRIGADGCFELIDAVGSMKGALLQELARALDDWVAGPTDTVTVEAQTTTVYAPREALEVGGERYFTYPIVSRDGHSQAVLVLPTASLEAVELSEAVVTALTTATAARRPTAATGLPPTHGRR